MMLYFTQPVAPKPSSLEIPMIKKDLNGCAARGRHPDPRDAPAEDDRPIHVANAENIAPPCDKNRECDGVKIDRAPCIFP